MMISNQGKTVLAVQVVQILCALIAVSLLPTSILSKLVSILVVLVFMGIGAFLNFYSVNCMVVGECNVFAWIIVGCMLVSVVFATVAWITAKMFVKKAHVQQLHEMIASGAAPDESAHKK